VNQSQNYQQKNWWQYGNSPRDSFHVLRWPNDQKLSHGHRKVTPKCNRDNQISYHRRNAWRSGRWLQRSVRPRIVQPLKKPSAKNLRDTTSSALACPERISTSLNLAAKNVCLPTQRSETSESKSPPDQPTPKISKELSWPNVQELSHSHRSRTPAWNIDIQISFRRRICKGGGCWLQRSVRPHNRHNSKPRQQSPNQPCET
jgi:hypothetical protein